MLNAIRIIIGAYTASFRAPGFIRYQLTLPVPPLSTIYGIVSAAAGSQVTPYDIEWLAYRLDYAGKAFDLETIIEIERDKPWKMPIVKGRNVIKREFLAMPVLTLYLPVEWREVFERPRYPILLGRSQDLGAVESITQVDLEEVDEGEVSGVILPMEIIAQGSNRVNAWLQNLPIAFTDEPRRRLLGMKIFGMVDSHQEPVSIRAPGWLVRETATVGDADYGCNKAVPLYRKEWMQSILVF